MQIERTNNRAWWISCPKKNMTVRMLNLELHDKNRFVVKNNRDCLAYTGILCTTNQTSSDKLSTASGCMAQRTLHKCRRDSYKFSCQFQETVLQKEAFEHFFVLTTILAVEFWAGNKARNKYPKLVFSKSTRWLEKFATIEQQAVHSNMLNMKLVVDSFNGRGEFRKWALEG